MMMLSMTKAIRNRLVRGWAEFVQIAIDLVGYEFFGVYYCFEDYYNSMLYYNLIVIQN